MNTYGSKHLNKQKSRKIISTGTKILGHSYSLCEVHYNMKINSNLLWTLTKDRLNN